MRTLLILGAVSLLTLRAAMAQVTVDLHALQALPERAGAPQAPRPPSVATTRPGPSAQGGATQVPASPAGPVVNAAPAPAPAAPPALPEAVPQTATIAPIAPPAPATPPPAPPVSADASAAATPSAAGPGLRVTFGPGQSDLSPDAAAAIKTFAETASGGDAALNVLAYAPGAADDPSTARRVSLARAMAVRNALMTDGVPSARIFVRALGAQYGSGPADRVDIDLAGANTR